MVERKGGGVGNRTPPPSHPETQIPWSRGPTTHKEARWGPAKDKGPHRRCTRGKILSCGTDGGPCGTHVTSTKLHQAAVVAMPTSHAHFPWFLPRSHVSHASAHRCLSPTHPTAQSDLTTTCSVSRNDHQVTCFFIFKIFYTSAVITQC